MCKKLVCLTSFVLVLSLANNAFTAKDPSLIIYYSFDDVGDIIADQSGKGHDGVVVGDVTAGPEGKVNGAAKFASGSYLDLDGPSFPAEDIPTSGMTLAAWIKCENTGGDHAIFNARASDATWLVHPEARSNGVFRWLLRARGMTTLFDIRAGSVPWDEWVHFAGTYDKATSKAYLYNNGELVGQANVAASLDIAGDYDLGARVGYNIDNARPFTGLMDEFFLYKRPLTQEEIQTIMEGLISPKLASNPIPEDETADVPRDVALGWTPGETAQTHDVYLGKVFDDVNDADRNNPLDVLLSQGQDANTYEPGRLELDQMYYWRVDEIEADGITIHTGEVWSFTVEPLAYPIENITATASSSEVTKGPENAINGSGLDESGLLHGNIGDNNIWLSSPSGEQPTWIEFEFDKIYKLHQVLVWNSNESLEPIIGLGFKDVTIEYSLDGTDYMTLWTTHEFAQAPGTPDYAHNTTIEFNGTAAKYVRLTANSNWGGILTQYGLSEVRFLHIPVYAKMPVPDSGATNVSLEPTLNWSAGRDAAEHNIYLSDDEQAVIDGTADVVTVTDNSYRPLSLDLGKTYYWRVDEVNNTETPNIWQGELWDFTIKDYLVLEDFEDYNDFEPDRIFDTWIDGYSTTTNGSTIGYAEPDFPAGEHFVETTTIHGGTQSMPYFYDNTTVMNSEATMTLEYPRNWTENGIGTLTLWFRGDFTNSAELMYVVINGSVAVYNNNSNAAMIPGWVEWNIDLQEFADQGMNLTNISTIGLGFGNRSNPQAGGSGLVYFDDIRLYPPPPEPEPVL